MLHLDKKLYKSISEVASELDVNESLLRYWETQFSQFSPMRRSGKRLYTDSDVETAKKIKEMLHEKGFTIKGAQKLLQNSGNSDVKREIKNVIEYLKSLKEFLLRYSE